MVDYCKALPAVLSGLSQQAASASQTFTSAILLSFLPPTLSQVSLFFPCTFLQWLNTLGLWWERLITMIIVDELLSISRPFLVAVNYGTAKICALFCSNSLSCPSALSHLLGLPHPFNLPLPTFPHSHRIRKHTKSNLWIVSCLTCEKPEESEHTS